MTRIPDQDLQTPFFRINLNRKGQKVTPKSDADAGQADAGAEDNS
jgi:hypothetical protein